MIKIKNLIARTIKNLGKILTFALLILPSFAICCLLGSWTIDENGNLIGSNLINVYNYTYGRDNRGTATPSTNDTITFTSDNSEYCHSRIYWNNLNIGYTYTISYTGSGNGNFNQVYLESSGTDAIGTNIIDNSSKLLNSLPTRYSVTFRATKTTLCIVAYINANNPIAGKTIVLSKIMLNEGNTAQDWEPNGVYYSSQNYYDLQTQYNQALEGTQIDYTNYTIQLVSYPTTDTTSNYNVVQNLNTRNYVNDQGFLDIYGITQISGFGDTWDGIVIQSNSYLNTYNYNLLFNGSGNPNLDFALYYKYYESEKFRKLSLMNIVGDSAYYGYFDLINLFGKNAIEENIQDILYNKFAIHWTNIPNPNDLINIKLNSTDGYNMGYAKGVQDNLINLEELNETIEEQTRQLQEKQRQYDNLLEHYNNAQLNNPLSSMVVAVADIPLNLFHQMFDFNIMGFNLSAFILGIITILLVAYVIKLFL